MSSSRFLFSNGVLLHTSDVPPVKSFLESHPGAYTTSRTHNNASLLLFCERHMKRLSESIKILSSLAPQLLFKSNNSAILIPTSSTLPIWQPAVQMLVKDSICKVLPVALQQRNDCEELAITTLVSGEMVYIWLWWAMGGMLQLQNILIGIRKPLEKLRPPSVTELLLSNDGDQILEGCVTNFFVVCSKECDSNVGKAMCDYGNKYSFEVQTAPITDGVLPGIIRQLVLEVCKTEGIPFREVSPSWSERELWEEAFITNSLRLLQHVDSIQVPTEWHSAHSKTWKDISWTKKQFHVGGPGMITTVIQEKIMKKAILEGYPISNIYAG